MGIRCSKPPAERTAASTPVLYKAVFDYNSYIANGLSFKAGDKFTVNRGQGDWLSAVHVASGKKGWIPRNHIIKLYDEQGSINPPVNNGNIEKKNEDSGLISNVKRRSCDELPQVPLDVCQVSHTEPTITPNAAISTTTPNTAPTVTPNTAPTVTPNTAPTVTPNTAPTVTPTTTPTIDTDTKRYKAMFDYDGVHADDLQFKKGDMLQVQTSGLAGDWWLAKHLKTENRGYIPHDYVCEDDDLPQHQEWWCNFDRSESDKMLLLPNKQVGTFLVRPSSDESSYALSIRETRGTNDDPCVKHYLIHKRDNGGVYFNNKHNFSSVHELIEYYKEHKISDCCCLTDICPKVLSVPIRPFEIERSAIKLLHKLADGFYGSVYKAELNNQTIVAVKTLKPGRMTTNAFLREAEVMKCLNHRRLITMYHVCSETEPIWIITEYMKNGSLLKYLRSDKGRQTKFPTLINMASQVAEGMTHLESLNLIHRDLRADNILLGEHYEVKICDFGLARDVDNAEGVFRSSKDTKFPINWTAPEAITGFEFNIKSDVWSFGILLYELITFGAKPNPGVSKGELVDYILSGGVIRKPGFVYCPDEYYDIMLKCWKLRPEERPTFESLYFNLDTYFISI